MITRSRPYIPPADHAGIVESWLDILSTEQFINGKYVSTLEENFARRCSQTKYAVATNSGASALEIAIRAMDVKNAKILVPTNTFPASVSAIIRSGNVPVLTDIDLDTMCMSYETMMDRMDDDVRGVMTVHMAGLISPDIMKVKKYCDERDIFLMEDASHAVGASCFGHRAGDIGTVGCFSLFATKIITTGEGGMITTNSEHIKDNSIIYRNHGCFRNQSNIGGFDAGVTCVDASCNYRMPELSAVLGISQIDRLDEFIMHRNRIANYYSAVIQSSKIADKVILPPIYYTGVQTWWQYIIKLRPELGYDRNEICGDLYQLGVETANAYYPACHQQPAYKQYIKDNHTFPNANDVLTRHIALPMHVRITAPDIEDVVSALEKVL